MKNKIFVLFVVACAVIAFFVLKFSSPVTPKSKPVSQSIPMGSFTRMHSPSIGNTSAAVTVVEWFDPECESCSAIHPVLKKIIEDYKDRVRFVFRYMPYHGNSIYAASAIEEAREFGKFEEALDILFEKQPDWADHHQPKPELIPIYLASIGVPKDKLTQDYLINKHGEKIRQDEADGKGVGVRGTPTFFVNGQLVHELGEQPLRQAIEAALNAGH